MPTDVLLQQDELGDYDLTLDENGDITNGDFFDSSIIYAIFGERRALEAEVPAAERRRGWTGNEFSDFENGSKLWLYEQSKLTKTVLNSIESAAFNALKWLIEDDFAVSVQAKAVVNSVGIALDIEIKRKNSKVDQRFFQLWENTGISNAT